MKRTDKERTAPQIYDQSVRRRRVSFTPTPAVRRALEDLVATGLFGFSISDCARRLVDESVRYHRDFLPGGVTAKIIARRKP